MSLVCVGNLALVVVPLVLALLLSDPQQASLSLNFPLATLVVGLKSRLLLFSAVSNCMNFEVG